MGSLYQSVSQSHNSWILLSGRRAQLLQHFAQDTNEGHCHSREQLTSTNKKNIENHLSMTNKQSWLHPFSYNKWPNFD